LQVAAYSLRFFAMHDDAIAANMSAFRAIGARNPRASRGVLALNYTLSLITFFWAHMMGIRLAETGNGEGRQSQEEANGKEIMIARIVPALFGAMLASCLLVADEAVVQRISPVPPWPADGNIPADLADQHVFFNPQTNEIVVVPPPGPSGVFERFEFELHNQAIPTVSARVTRQADGM
jgi:hypothetical protein